MDGRLAVGCATGVGGARASAAPNDTPGDCGPGAAGKSKGAGRRTDQPVFRCVLPCERDPGPRPSIG